MNPNDTVAKIIENVLSPLGFEIHPFKVGWYNEAVQKAFQLPYKYDTLAFLILSTPKMFEKAFLPFICDDANRDVKDPINDCMAHCFNKLKQEFLDHKMKVMHDFHFTANRRPQILVQTAAHVSGAACYYQRTDVINGPWNSKQKIFGVCIHPKYGGWFGLRGVAIFEDLFCSELDRKTPKNVLQTDEQKIDVLEKFNYHWEDNSFRDVIPVEESYSEKQRKYFSTKPQDRFHLIEQFRNDICRI